MGNDHSKISESYNPTMAQWQLIPSPNDTTIWKNINTKQQIQQYSFIFNQSNEYEKLKQSHQFRYESNIFVSSIYFKDQTSRDMCSTFFKSKLYLERIPFRITNFVQIPFLEALHIYKQAFMGFNALYSHFGFFYVDQQMIGFNKKFRAKVWSNYQFQKFTTSQYLDQSIQKQYRTEKYMISRILEIIDTRMNRKSFPEDFVNFIVSASPNTLKAAEMLLYQFASKYHVNIPQQLDCLMYVDELKIQGKAVNLSELIVQENKNLNINPRNINQFDIPFGVTSKMITVPPIQKKNNQTQNQIYSSIKTQSSNFVSNGNTNNNSQLYKTEPFKNQDNSKIIQKSIIQNNKTSLPVQFINPNLNFQSHQNGTGNIGLIKKNDIKISYANNNIGQNLYKSNILINNIKPNLKINYTNINNTNNYITNIKNQQKILYKKLQTPIMQKSQQINFLNTNNQIKKFNQSKSSTGYQYEYTSPQILTLLNKKFDNIDVSRQNGKQKLKNLSNYSQMKYSILQNNGSGLNYQYETIPEYNINYSLQNYKLEELKKENQEIKYAYNNIDKDLIEDLKKLKQNRQN